MVMSCKKQLPKTGNTSYCRTIIKNLRLREINGIGHAYQTTTNHHKTPPSHMFSCIPKRLAFSLKNLVEEHTLMEEAHVFLGFNSNGSYVISYTESFGAIDQLGMPSYSYRLHWWLFQLGKKMIKVNSVRLFANEEITTYLQLYYAEWPQDKNKVLVYGCSKGSEVCYITVAAIPPIMTCSNCSDAMLDNSGESSKCLEHGFVAHMTYSSVSSSSAVLNASGLQIDNLIVLNMGHSIGVISLGMLSSHKDTECLPLSSIKRATFEEKPNISETEDFVSPTICEKANDSGLLLSPRIIKNNRNIFLSPSADNERTQYYKNNSFTVSSETQTSNASTRSSSQLSDWDSVVSSSSNDLSQTTCITFNEIQSVSDHCNCTESYNDVFDFDKEATKNEASRIDPYVDPEPKSIVLLQRDCENTYNDAGESLITRDDHAKFLNKIVAGDKQSENCCCGYATSSRCSEHNSQQNRYAKVLKTSKLNQDSKANGESNKQLKVSWDSNMKSQTHRQSSCKPTLNICGYCGLKIKDTKNSHNKKETPSASPVAPSRSSLLGSPVRASSKLLFLSSIRSSKDSPQDLNCVELNAPTPSPSASESSGSVYCTGDNASQASVKSGNYRKSDGILTFYETLYELSKDAASNVVDDGIAESSLFYGPVTFEGANGAPLQPVKSDSYELSVAYSQHLVLDVEHVIFDVLRTRCYTTYKFGYLIDYDVQIIDTCSNTRSVVVLIVALLNVVPRKSKTKWQEHHYRLNGHFDTTTSAKSQQFHFYICWQLQTGRYEVVAASPLHIFDRKKSGKWDASWVLEKRHAIRKACAIPQCGHRSVYVLSNSSVFRGKSMEYLWDVDHVIALKR